MNIVSSKIENDILTIYLCGKVDSSNAAQVQAQVDEECKKGSFTECILDLDDLEYISSAGLRMVLHLRKNQPTLKLINASSEVYEIFDMTGFTEMIPISKGYRKISVDNCEVIGQGANGKVYRIDPDTIVKVYFNPDALPDIHRERELARRAFVLGIPTAIPYDVVKVGEGYGSVFELLNAKSFAKLIAENPDDIDKYIDLSVDLLKKIHSTEVRPEDMPDMRDVAIGWAEFVKEYLPEDKGEKLVKLVKDVPVQHTMIHGDYHIKNVMVQDGEVLLIDMDTLCQGHPIFELGSVFNAYMGFSEIDNSISLSFLGIPHELSKYIWDRFIPLYLGTDDANKINEVREKSMLIGYTRLMRRLIRRKGLESEDGRKTIEVYKNHICDILDRVNELTF